RLSNISPKMKIGVFLMESVRNDEAVRDVVHPARAHQLAWCRMRVGQERRGPPHTAHHLVWGGSTDPMTLAFAEGKSAWHWWTSAHSASYRSCTATTYMAYSSYDNTRPARRWGGGGNPDMLHAMNPVPSYMSMSSKNALEASQTLKKHTSQLSHLDHCHVLRKPLSSPPLAPAEQHCVCCHSIFATDVKICIITRVFDS
ncbi:hypothetical protein BV22DRAFT_1052857, partial [Leucogyrophana mollusca]